MDQKKNEQYTNLLGDALTVFSFTMKDNVTFAIQHIACRDHTKHLQWPAQTLFN
jgi:hypothetical protein